MRCLLVLGRLLNGQTELAYSLLLETLLYRTEATRELGVKSTVKIGSFTLVADGRHHRRSVEVGELVFVWNLPERQLSATILEIRAIEEGGVAC
jgi:hypothetical protein